MKTLLKTLTVAALAAADLAADVVLTRDEIQERMSGNLCRCGAHNGIIDAIQATMAPASTAETSAEMAA